MGWLGERLVAADEAGIDARRLVAEAVRSDLLSRKVHSLITDT